MSYDSRPDTREHIAQVRALLGAVMKDLGDRRLAHDASKLVEPELSTFDEFTPKLSEAKYGSPEYKQALKDMGEGLQHHYRFNDHHPEHFDGGIHEMNLLQLVEMLADWKAAGMRPGGTNDLRKSIKYNSGRYDVPGSVERLLVSTAEYLGWL